MDYNQSVGDNKSENSLFLSFVSRRDIYILSYSYMLQVHSLCAYAEFVCYYLL